MRGLTGKSVIVTGGGMGLGKAIASTFANEGARVAVVDLNHQAALETAAALGSGSSAYELDVTDAAAVDSVFGAVVDDFGGLDIVVNSAGVSFVGPLISETSDEAWERTIGVMQTGVFYSMRAAARIFGAQRSGALVNISSIRGISSNPGRIAYCAAKAAVIMMTRVAAAEWGPFGARANAIAPGPARTPMWTEDVRRGVVDERQFIDATPIPRLAEPEEIGALAAFLCSDDAAFINGECVTIDGGLSTIPGDGVVIRPRPSSDAAGSR